MAQEISSLEVQNSEWFRSWFSSFIHPIRNFYGIAFLVIPIVIYWAMRMPSRFGVLAVFGMMIVLLLIMYHAILSGARADDPDAFYNAVELDWETGIQFLAQTVIILLFCFGPAALLHIAQVEIGFWKTIGILFLALLGAVYLPVPLLAISIFETWGVLVPTFVFQSLCRLAGPFLVCSIYFLALNSPFLFEIMNWDNPLLHLEWTRNAGTGVLFWMIYLYLLNVWCRSLGMIYRCYQHRLRWA